MDVIGKLYDWDVVEVTEEEMDLAIQLLDEAPIPMEGRMYYDPETDTVKGESDAGHKGEQGHDAET